MITCLTFPGKPTDDTARRFSGHCADSKGNHKNTGARQLKNQYATAEDCLRACRRSLTYKEKTGCTYYATGKTCWVHTGDVASGCGSPDNTCFVLGIYVSLS